MYKLYLRLYDDEITLGGSRAFRDVIKEYFGATLTDDDYYIWLYPRIRGYDVGFANGKPVVVCEVVFDFPPDKYDDIWFFVDEMVHLGYACPDTVRLMQDKIRDSEETFLYREGRYTKVKGV